MKTSLIVHGGAGTWRPGSDDDALAGTAAAVEAGRKVLAAGGSAVDAVLPRRVHGEFLKHLRRHDTRVLNLRVAHERARNVTQACWTSSATPSPPPRPDRARTRGRPRAVPAPFAGAGAS